MRKREYLKHKLWKNINTVEEASDILPMRLSMRNSAMYGNCNWKPFGYCSRGRSWKSMNKKISRFIKNHIGKNFNKTYSEFKKKFPETFGDINLSIEFKDRFREYQDRWYNCRNGSFYIDKNGQIRDGYQVNHKDKKTKINIRNKETLYSFNDNVFNDLRVLNLVRFYLPGNYDQYLNSGIKFSEKIYNKIFFFLDKTPHLSVELVKLHPLDWWIKNKYCYWFDSRYCYYLSNPVTLKSLSSNAMKKFLFKEHVTEDCDIVKIGSPEFRRDFENKRKKIASQDRIRDKEKEHSLEILLHTIVSERRKKELDEENNLVTRDRLGFNDESFKGEEYHGQKRKKNKV